MRIHHVKLNQLQRHEERAGWLFVLPVVLGILIFQFYPVLFSLYISFTDWNLITAPEWLGPANYIALFTSDPVFFKTIQNTLTYLAGTVGIGLPLALLFAILLNRNIRGQSIYRAIYFIPVIAPTTAMALLWRWMYDADFGVINNALRWIGLPGPRWLTSTHWAMWAIIIEAIWASLGLNIVILLAGLQSISTEYYEAAELDGANGWQQMFRITLPLLSPVTFFVLVTSLIGAFQVFDLPYVMTGGGPANATQMIVTYLYGYAFRLQRMGLAAAMGYIVFIMILLVTFLNFRLEKRWVFYETAEDA